MEQRDRKNNSRHNAKPHQQNCVNKLLLLLFLLFLRSSHALSFIYFFANKSTYCTESQNKNTRTSEQPYHNENLNAHLAQSSNNTRTCFCFFSLSSPILSFLFASPFFLSSFASFVLLTSCLTTACATGGGCRHTCQAAATQAQPCRPVAARVCPGRPRRGVCVCAQLVNVVNLKTANKKTKEEKKKKKKNTLSDAL